MKLTFENIRQIIIEEISKVLDEGVLKKHRDKKFHVQHNGVIATLIPLSSDEFDFYKNQGFLKHFANIKDFKTQLGKPTNVEDFMPENLTGYYAVIENSGLHNAGLKHFPTTDRFLLILDGNKNDMKKTFLQLWRYDLLLSSHIVETAGV